MAGFKEGVLHLCEEEAIGEVSLPDPADKAKMVDIAICQSHLEEFSQVTEVELDTESQGLL